MTEKELYKLTKFNEEHESYNFIANEIFDDLKSNINNASHIAFSYSYIYFCQWLYRYCKHVNINMFDNFKIKEILGYDANNRTLNYLIKKDGLLDKIEYLQSTKEYPISWSHSKEDSLEFLMVSDISDDYNKEYLPVVPRRFFLKKPLKGFYRVVENEEECEIEGSFYSIERTHNVPFEAFAFSMSKESIGCIGFYLYSFLKQKNDIHSEGVDISIDNLAKDTMLSRRTVTNYLGVLKSYKMIDFIYNQDYFVIGMTESDGRKATTYNVRDYDFFSDNAVDYKRIGVRSKEWYDEYLKEREDTERYIQNTDIF